MAGEIQANFSSGATLYCLIRNRVGQVWNTSGLAFETYQTANYADYDVSLVEQGSASGFYIGTMPATIAAGVYSVVVKRQVAGSAAESDPSVAVGDLQWNGTVTMPLSDTATSGQLGQLQPMRLARGTMIQNFLFDLVSSVDHVTPFTSGSVSGQILRDDGSFGALQSGAFIEKGLGVYRLLALTSGDLLCNTAFLVFTAAGVSGGTSDPRRYQIITQRTSGQ